MNIPKCIKMNFLSKGAITQKNLCIKERKEKEEPHTKCLTIRILNNYDIFYIKIIIFNIYKLRKNDE